jgi:hypothetical protein
LETISDDENISKTAFLVNTMLFYHCSDQLFEVYAGNLRECIEARPVLFFLPLSVSDFSARSLRQLLTSFRRQVEKSLTYPFPT